ncbi:unnamed protein product [Paramecium pentaurelia]|uniref:Uncharacterized protein n=1 Tax=Paramecium pentaurelia TaxID=43138 RepID=A0A8S1U738_9CILI|nr:unnamed protein product [Paramecium pentaurelia]
MHENESKLSEVNAPPLFICFDVVNKLTISLQSVHYIVNVQPGFAIVEIQQNYNTQHYEVPIELEYMFTIQKDSVVSKMVAELGDIKVFGIVKELEEAKKEYQQGIQAGKTMILGEQDKQITDLKKVKIGCLAPGKSLKITFEYIQPLKVYLNQFWMLQLSPMVDSSYLTIGCLAPGKSLKITFEYIQPLKVYLNQFWMLELSPMVDSSYLTVYQLKNQSVNYPQLYNQIQKSLNFQGLQQNYQQDITININLQKPITFVKSPTHQILINNDDNQFVKENFTKNQIIILDKKYPNNFLPNKKFELLFSSDDVNSPHSFLTHTNNDALQHIKYCATLTLIPKFNEVPLDDAYSSYINGLNLSSETKINRGNYYFFIDRSGSMGGQRIQKAKQSLILFLKSQPKNSLFNVISFGSQPKRMFENSQVYNQKSLNQVISQVNSMEADLGGPDVFSALKNGKDSKSHLETYNAFLLTDGQIIPDPESITAIKKMKNQLYKYYFQLPSKIHQTFRLNVLTLRNKQKYLTNSN